ncbi:MAG TPA: FKBP-type peptidyl-prolyl cis-trans isomerase, partial [Bacteroidales bacterium]|nr:FKBP-type peptidyl-prolyl cis-trans isomerase [Bacteroidales bacterium]
EMSDDEARAFIMIYVNEREEERAAQQAEQNKILYKDYIMQNEEFLNKNKENPNVTVTSSGLQYEVIKMGTGEKPTLQNTVKVHYTGTLIDGTKFDSSVDRGEPAEFPVSAVIAGWTEALQLMPVGSKFRIWLPENIAYGANGAGDVIKPFSTLIFEVELLEITQ